MTIAQILSCRFSKPKPRAESHDNAETNRRNWIAYLGGAVATAAFLIGAYNRQQSGELIAAAHAATEINAKSTGRAFRLPGYNLDRNAYFGDLHVHTYLSFDAYMFNVRATPNDA